MYYDKQIKQFILENFYNKKHTICSSYINKFKRDNPEKYIEITNLVPFVITDRFSEVIYCILNDIMELPECYCGKYIKTWSSKGYAKTCSLLCHLKSTKKKEKTINTNLEKYGNINVFQNEEVKKKSSETKFDKYGDKYYNNKEKTKLTNRKILYETHLKYIDNNIEPLFDESEHNKPITEKQYFCKKCNKSFFLESWQNQSNQIRCIYCKPKYKSQGEGEIQIFLNDLDITYKKEDRTLIKPKELDFVLHNHNIAIEYHGLLWHSYGEQGYSYLNNWKNEDKNRHLFKSNECNKKGFKLLHIFQNEWENTIKQKIWKSIIKSNLQLNETIGARKCNIKILSSLESNIFLDNNHLQGKDKSSIRLGLIHNNEIVSVLTLSKSRFNKNYDWEIIRFANKIDTNVIGSFSKLLNYFKKQYNGSIITYADKRYSNGCLYKTNGFEELKDSPPNYWYFKISEMVLHSRIKFQKHKLNDILENFDVSLSEWENIRKNGYRRIWDCGNKVFVLK